MSQLRYMILIIESLLKSDNHIRGLAKELNTNQMMISRRLKELIHNNIVDYRLEGKNKVFFLKKSLEAREWLYITEHYKCTAILKSYPLLKSVFQKIMSHSKITLALLFGSYAKGRAHKDSDIDIYLETKSKLLKNEIEQVNSKINIKIGKYDKNNLLIKEIEKNHIVIKGVEQYYNKCRFFT